MLQLAPPAASCAVHAGLPARFICPRCGSFMCPDCERRTRPDAVPMCVGCWGVREQKVGPIAAADKPSTALQTAGLVVGAIAMLPLPGVQIAALVLTIMGIVRVKSPEARAVRWRSVTGLCLVGVGLIVDVVVFSLVK